MKRIALAAALFALAACAKADDTAATDTTTPGMAPAPGATTMADSMRPDSAGMTTATKAP